MLHSTVNDNNIPSSSHVNVNTNTHPEPTLPPTLPPAHTQPANTQPANTQSENMTTKQKLENCRLDLIDLFKTKLKNYIANTVLDIGKIITQEEAANHFATLPTYLTIPNKNINELIKIKDRNIDIDKIYKYNKYMYFTFTNTIFIFKQINNLHIEEGDNIYICNIIDNSHNFTHMTAIIKKKNDTSALYSFGFGTKNKIRTRDELLLISPDNEFEMAISRQLSNNSNKYFKIIAAGILTKNNIQILTSLIRSNQINYFINNIDFSPDIDNITTINIQTIIQDLIQDLIEQVDTQIQITKNSAQELITAKDLNKIRYITYTFKCVLDTGKYSKYVSTHSADGNCASMMRKVFDDLLTCGKIAEHIIIYPKFCKQKPETSLIHCNKPYTKPYIKQTKENLENCRLHLINLFQAKFNKHITDYNNSIDYKDITSVSIIYEKIKENRTYFPADIQDNNSNITGKELILKLDEYKYLINMNKFNFTKSIIEINTTTTTDNIKTYNLKMFTDAGDDGYTIYICKILAFNQTYSHVCAIIKNNKNNELYSFGINKSRIIPNAIFESPDLILESHISTQLTTNKSILKIIASGKLTQYNINKINLLFKTNKISINKFWACINFSQINNTTEIKSVLDKLKKIGNIFAHNPHVKINQTIDNHIEQKLYYYYIQSFAHTLETNYKLLTRKTSKDINCISSLRAIFDNLLTCGNIAEHAIIYPDFCKQKPYTSAAVCETQINSTNNTKTPFCKPAYKPSLLNRLKLKFKTKKTTHHNHN